MKKKTLDEKQLKNLCDLNIKCSTIEDLLDVLPSQIKIIKSNGTNLLLELCIRKNYTVSYEDSDNAYLEFISNNEELIDCLYDALLWVIKNKYL